MANPLGEPKEFDCTPSSLLASYPCLSCLSEKQMLAAMVGITAYVSRTYHNNLPLLLKNSACFMCLSKKQMLQAFVTMLGSTMIGDTPGAMQEVIDEMKCLLCASEKQLLAAFLHMMCNDITFTYEPQT
jgi:hypothetical protein